MMAFFRRNTADGSESLKPWKSLPVFENGGSSGMINPYLSLRNSNIPLEHTPDPQALVYDLEILNHICSFGVPGVCSFRGLLLEFSYENLFLRNPYEDCCLGSQG